MLSAIIMAAAKENNKVSVFKLILKRFAIMKNTDAVTALTRLNIHIAKNVCFVSL